MLIKQNDRSDVANVLSKYCKKDILSGNCFLTLPEAWHDNWLYSPGFFEAAIVNILNWLSPRYQDVSQIEVEHFVDEIRQFHGNSQVGVPGDDPTIHSGAYYLAAPVVLGRKKKRYSGVWAIGMNYPSKFAQSTERDFLPVEIGGSLSWEDRYQIFINESSETFPDDEIHVKRYTYLDYLRLKSKVFSPELLHFRLHFERMHQRLFESPLNLQYGIPCITLNREIVCLPSLALHIKPRAFQYNYRYLRKVFW